MKRAVLYLICACLTGCAVIDPWEDPLPASTHAERVHAVQEQTTEHRQQLDHQLADGSISRAAYDDMVRQNREYLRSIQ